MKRIDRETRIRRLTAKLAVLLLASTLGVAASADQAGGGESHQHRHPQALEETALPEACAAMMAKRETWLRQQGEMASKLEERVAAMTAAPADGKVAAMESVLLELVTQLQSTRAKGGHHQEMMAHMMKHMASGEMHGEGGSMMEMCPMMKAMHDQAGAETAADGHAEHDHSQ